MNKVHEEGKKIGFLQAIKDFFIGFVDFKGRSTRGGYWWLMLASFLFGIAFEMILGITGLSKDTGTFGVIVVAMLLVLVIPSITLQVRRLRDVGYSILGIVLFFVIPIILNTLRVFIPLIGIVALIFNILILVTCALPTDYHVGKFGKLTRSAKVK